MSSVTPRKIKDTTTGRGGKKKPSRRIRSEKNRIRKHAREILGEIIIIIKNTSLQESCSSILMCMRRSAAGEWGTLHTYECMHTGSESVQAPRSSAGSLSARFRSAWRPGPAVINYGGLNVHAKARKRAELPDYTHSSTRRAQFTTRGVVLVLFFLYSSAEFISLLLFVVLGGCFTVPTEAGWERVCGPH